MGIKHFWHWFNNNFGKNIKKLQSKDTFNSVGVSIDNFMIDLNGVFHASAQKVYEYGNYKPPRRLLREYKHKRIGGLNTQIKVFRDVCETIESLLNVVKPRKRLILCIDGPAPLSKQNQQRQRRFRSANDKDDEEFKRFDSNCISPGTKFMDYLSKYIDWYIRKNISYNPLWRDIEVVFSNEKSPGEGEHKIINYIRFYGDHNDSYCIHGLDADLIMLSLGTHISKFWVLREDLYNPNNDFFLIDIGNTRIELSSIMNWKEEDKKHENVEFIPRYAVNDFIFMCFMVGNDFLPHIPSLEIIQGGIDQMLDVYKNVGESYGHLTTIIEEDVVFNKKALQIFLGTISQYDKGILEDKLLKKDKFFPDILLEKNAKFVEGKYELDVIKYRECYYMECFPKDIDIKDLCHQYLIGLQWVLSYYTKGVPDWKWCFHYHYAPFAHELAENIPDFTFPERKNSSPMKPFEQLLSILPPKSAGLIPIPLSQLLTDSKSKIKQFCPQNFKVDLSGKRKEWEGIVLLPMVDYKIIREEYLKHIDKVSSNDLKRNILGKSVIYRYDPKVLFKYKSYYGNIDECKINYEIIKI
jgi:5'-3' exoribonuclease 1